MSGSVWLTSLGRDYLSTEMVGVFTRLEKAKGACQELAAEFYGLARTPPLVWQGDEDYSYAVYHQPAQGVWLFQITKAELDKPLP